MKKITKKSKQAFIKDKLATNPTWALRGLCLVYSFQTASEQECEATTESNGEGFTGFDGEFLSSLARQYKLRKSLSNKQMQAVFKAMPKYWNQILGASDQDKLEILMRRV